MYHHHHHHHHHHHLHDHETNTKFHKTRGHQIQPSRRVLSSARSFCAVRCIPCILHFAFCMLANIPIRSSSSSLVASAGFACDVIQRLPHHNTHPWPSVPPPPPSYPFPIHRVADPVAILVAKGLRIDS